MATATKRWLVTAAMLTIGAAMPRAQAAPPAGALTLSLDDAVRLGVERAPRVAEARAREAAAASTVASRQAAGKPTLAASSTYLRTNHVDEFGIPQANGSVRIIFPDIPSNYSVRGELAVPIYTGGRVENAVDAARADVRATAADRQVAEADVRLDVSRAYWLLVTARESVHVLEQALARADASLGDVKARVDAGVLPPNDLLSSQAQRARQSVQLIQARNAAALAEIQLARLIGEEPGRAIVTSSPVDQPVAGSVELAAQGADALVARAAERRAERTGLNERKAGLLATGEAALATLKPQMAAIAAVEPARPNQRFVPRADEWRTSWDLGVSLRWPILDGGRARADRAAAIAQADAADARLKDLDAGIAVEVRQRLLDLSSARAALAASDEAVAAATEARRVVEERFRAGVATSTDVLEAQVALLEAELERTRLMAGQRLSEAQLIRAVGGV